MASTPGKVSTPTVARVPHTRVRLGRSKNVIYSTYHHVIELYGPQMPVLVAESLHYIPGAKTTASVNLNAESAWAWYVCGRKLLVWHIPSYTDSGLTVLAKEMMLPSSGLQHHADLVTVFSDSKQSLAPSCIAVSPEGVIRYWEIIGHHSSWVDVNANLGGEEVCGVHYIPPIGCLAVTTSGTMFIITPKVVKGTATVVTQFVSEMPKWFDSLGRRVSSIIFGGASAQPGLESKIVKILPSCRVPGYWNIFLLSGFSLNSWVIQIEGAVCNHLYECNLEPIIKKVFPEEIAEDPDCELIITDIRPSEGGSVTVMVVSSNPRIYAIVELNGNDIEPPDTASPMCILSDEDVAVLEEEGRMAQLKFLLLPTNALVFNKFVIFAVPLSGGEEHKGEPLDLPGGVVLGGLMHKTTPIFFSATYGFVSVTPVNTGCIDVINISSLDTKITPRAIIAREPVSTTTADYVTSLKLAFIHYIRKNTIQCLEVIKKEFPLEDNEDVVDSVFASTLVKVSLDIINDFSPKDFRWGEIKEDSMLPGSRSLHLDTQLAEKKQAHDIYLKFAKDISSEISLGRVTRKGTTVRTIHILYEHNEKVLACILLKKLQKKYPCAISQCVSRTAYEMQFMPTNEISTTDFFFRYVSIVDEGLKKIISKCVDLSYHNLGSPKFSKLLVVTNTIVIGIFNAILRVRARKGYFLDPCYVPWLSAPEPNGLFDHLSSLSQVNYEALSRYGKQTHRYKRIMSQFFYICNILLYCQMPHMDRSDFNALSASVITFFVDFKMHFQGLQLAYKYKNFEYLVKLTYFMDQEAQIKNYIELFGDEGFCYDLFNYLYRNHKYQELLNLELPEQYVEQLETFLTQFPTLDWLYKLKSQDYHKANQILMELSNDENANFRTQEIMFNLAKLTALTGSCPDLNRINSNIEIINTQKQISQVVFVRKGYDLNSLKMLPPSELIELFTGEENFDGDEYDFKRALELLSFIGDSTDHESLRKKIWRRAIDRDEWESVKFDLSPEILEQFIFFKLLKVVKSSDENLQSLIPPAEEFVEDPEYPMFTKTSFSTYLLEYGYELIMGAEDAQFDDDLDYLTK